MEAQTIPSVVQIKRFVSKPIFRFSLVGLIVRLLLAPFLGHPFDLRVFMAVGWAVAHRITPYGQYVLHHIFAHMSHPHLYGTFLGIGYPPPWGLICGLMYKVSEFFDPNIYVYATALKVPIIIGDLVTALVVYKILQKKLNERSALKAYCLYLFCPFLLLIGVVWGMFDVLAFLFSILSAYFLLERRDLSSVSLGVACALKLIPTVLVPLYSILIYKSTRSWKRTAQYLLGAASVTGILVLLPMVLFNWPLSNLYHALTYHIGSSGPGIEYSFGSGVTYGCASPFNVVNVIRWFVPSVEMPSILNYLWIVACIVTYVYAFSRVQKVELASVIRWSFLIMLVFFTTRSWVSDQNLLFLFSFFMLTVLFELGQWKTIHALWILLSIFLIVHVPFIAFLWMPYPWTLNAASTFCDGPFGWTRWFTMSVLTFAWVGMCWYYVIHTRTRSYVVLKHGRF